MLAGRISALDVADGDVCCHGAGMFGKLRHNLPTLCAIAVRGLGVVAGFGIALVIGRNWGPEANGIYALVTQTAIFLSVLTVGGLDLSITRFFAAVLGRGNRISISGLMRTLMFTAALIVATVGFAWLSWGALTHHGFLSDLPGHVLPLLFLMLAARALIRALCGVLRAYGRYVLLQAVDGLIIPLTVLFALVAGILPSIETALYLTAAVATVAAVIGLVASAAAVLSKPPTAPVEDISIRSMLVVAVPIWGLIIAQNIADWYGLATVAAQHGARDAGLYRVAMQFASAFGIVSMSLFNIYSSQFSAAHAAGDFPKVARLARSATWLGTALTLPVALVVIVAVPQILAFIGSVFVEASTMLRVAVLSQILFLALGPPGLVLAMVGHERIILAVSIAYMMAVLIIAPIAATYLGSLGIVLSLSGLTIGRSIVEFVALKRMTGINSVTGSFAPPRRRA